MINNLANGTQIDLIGTTVRQQREIQNRKFQSDFDKAIFILATKILVDGQKIVVDDLYDGFTDVEVNEIGLWIGQIEGTGEPEKNG